MLLGSKPGIGRNMLIRNQELQAFQAPGGTSAAWNSVGMGVTPDNTTAPDGSNTADLQTTTLTSGAHNFYQNVEVTAQKYVASIYAKKGAVNSHRYLGIRFSDGITYNATAVFDLDNGVWVMNTNVGITDIGVENVGNGWWRFSAAWTFASVFYTANVGFEQVTSTGTDPGGSAVLGARFYLWRPMLHPGSAPDPSVHTTNRFSPAKPIPARSINFINKSGSDFTIRFTTPHGMATGDTVIIAGTPQPAYSGTWVINNVSNPYWATISATLGTTDQTTRAGTATVP